MRQLLNARAALMLFLAAGLAAGGVSAAAPSVVGVAAAVVNDVRIKAGAARQFAKAALRQRVAIADQVQTGAASRLQLVLLDKSKFTVGANARLTIDRFVYDPAGTTMSASVAKGAFRFMSGRSGGGGSKSIGTPAATIGIRGTLLDVVVGEEAIAIARGEREIRGAIEHDPATATLIVLRGPGAGRQGNDAIGAVDVEAGGRTATLDRPSAAAYVPHAGATPIVFAISSSGIARLNDMLIEPREILANPNAPQQPYIAQPQRERPDYRDRPPGGGFDDGSGQRGGGYGQPGIPNFNNLPRNPGGQRDRPARNDNQRQSQPSPTPSASAVPDTMDRSSATPSAAPSDPPPQLQSQPQSQPTGTPSPTGSPSPKAGASPSPNDYPSSDPSGLRVN